MPPISYRFSEIPQPHTCVSTGCPLPAVAAELTSFIDWLERATNEKRFIASKMERNIGRLTSFVVMESFREELLSFGAKFLEHGYFRAAFLVRGWVVKCPLHPQFIEATDCEFDILKQVPEENRKYFPEMYNLGNGVVLQELCSPSSRLYNLIVRAEIGEVADEMGIDDIRGDNVGFRSDGSPVMIDFTPVARMRHLKEKRWDLLRSLG